MKTVEWRSDESAATQLCAWTKLAGEPGLVHAVFFDTGDCPSPTWEELVLWTRSRAVTVAEVRTNISSAALDVALCSDLVYLRRGVELTLPPGQPSAGLLWALGRAGRAALARGLLGCGTIAEDEAVGLGIAQKVLEIGEELSISPRSSLVALSTARDLMRSSARARPALELAAFRLLFSSGDPRTGAKAFFERKTPDFNDSGSCGDSEIDP
jgi:enoyl-CoA hydratase/carnithine racemase